MRILAFDPGLNEVAYAVYDSEDGLVEAALIPNPYKTRGLVEKLLKAEMMALEASNRLAAMDRVDVAVIEASTASSEGRQNFNTFARMALVSGAALGACIADKAAFVPPAVWKSVKDKLENHDVMLADLNKKDRTKLSKFLAPVAKSKQHNILDAVCMALWAMEIYNEDT